MTRQLPLALALRHAPGLDDFIVGANSIVIDALRRLLAAGDERQLFLAGPPGSGRSHLLMAQCAAAEHQGWRCAYLPLRDAVADMAPAVLEGLEDMQLVAIDDVEAIAGNAAWEAALFALYNRARDAGRALLFSAGNPPVRLPLGLPDLRSRLAWGLTLNLQPLDDAGRRQLLQSLAARRAMKLPAEVAGYLLERTRRHPADLVATVEKLDAASLAQQRRLTIPFVRECLEL